MNEMNEMNDIEIVFTGSELLLRVFWAWCSRQGLKFSYGKPGFEDELRCASKAFADHVLHELIDFFDVDVKEGE